MKTSRLTSALRFAMLAVPVSAAGFAGSVAAQEEAEATKVERISVTGSRIQRTDVETSVPVTVISAAEIQLTGATNVADVLQKSPIAIAGADQSNSTFSLSSAGLNTTSLRNAGEARTLVLVNGRRFVSGSAPSSGYAVDLNAIPAATIERIEILKSASSAVYGSDAVAGVINIITKKDFEGVAINAQTGISDESDRKKNDIDVTVGKSWSGGNAYVSFGWHNDDGIAGPERPGQTGDLGVIRGVNRWGYSGSAYHPGTIIQLPDESYVNGDGSSYVSSRDSYDRGSRRQLIIPLERKYIAGSLTHEIAPDVNFFSEFNWMQVDSQSLFEPTPLALNDIWLKNYGGTVGHDVNSSLLIPDALKTVLTGAGVTDLINLPTIGRRMVEFGDRGNDATRTTTRLATGLDWSIDDNWTASTYLTWGETNQNQFSYGELNMERARTAFNVTELNGSVVCADPTARLQGCVPFNYFGEVSPEAVAYLSAPAKTIGKVEQLVVGATIAGELPVELPGGAIGIAGGFEYREESGKQSASDLAQIGATSSNRQAPTDGKFSVRDFFAEANFPILDNWSVDAAVRFGNYSSVGNITTWNLGTEFSPVDRIKLRASAAKAVRAPNVADLFAGETETFSTVSDPCNGVKVGDTGNVAANCLSIQPILDRATANGGVFELTQLEEQQSGGFVGGNPNVKEEKATTVSFGVVAEIMDGLSATIDWYKISIDDAISTTSRSLVLSRCYSVDPSSFDPACSGVVRRNEVGVATGIDSSSGNENNIKISGVDVELRHRLSLPAGELTTDFVYSYVDQYDIISVETGDVRKYAGEVLYPKHRFNINMNYGLDDFNVFWRLRYWHHVEDSLTGQTPHSYLPANLNRIGAVVYHDLQLSYQVVPSTNVYFGVNNLFDKQAPVLGQGSLYGGTGINTASEAYDVTGRYYYLGLRTKF